MKELLKEYRQTLRELKKEKESAEDHEQKIYAGMITDMEIAIKWMETGRPPGRTSGGVYGGSPSSAIIMNPEKMDYFNLKSTTYTPLDPFEEAENRIDKERKARKRA